MQIVIPVCLIYERVVVVNSGYRRSLLPFEQLSCHLLCHLMIIRVTLHNILELREIRPEATAGIAALDQKQRKVSTKRGVMHGLKCSIGKVPLIAQTFVLGVLRFADDDNRGIGLIEEGIVCFCEPNMRHVWHVADAFVVAAQCASERFEGVDVLVSTFIGRLTRRCDGGSEQ